MATTPSICLPCPPAESFDLAVQISDFLTSATSAQHSRLKLDGVPWIPGAWVYLRSEARQRQAHERSCSCCVAKLLVMMLEHTKPSGSVDSRSGTDTDTGVTDVRTCLVCVQDWVFMMQNCS